MYSLNVLVGRIAAVLSLVPAHEHHTARSANSTSSSIPLATSVGSLSNNFTPSTTHLRQLYLNLLSKTACQHAQAIHISVLETAPVAPVVTTSHLVHGMLPIV